MAHLEGAYEQVNQRLGSVDSRIGGVEQRLTSVEQRIEALGQALSVRIDGLRESMERKLNESDRKYTYGFFWMIGLLLVSIIIPQLQHFAAR